jgi:D-arabinose 1-dehydrogenase-like Zn-dependent alcohol dehydrogenase
VIVSYGMTLGPKMPWLMSAVLRNQEIRGSTMGSRREFAEMMEFVRDHNVRPVIDDVVPGLDLDKIDSMFDTMKRGQQFGKLVVQIADTGEDNSGSSRL